MKIFGCSPSKSPFTRRGYAIVSRARQWSKAGTARPILLVALSLIAACVPQAIGGLTQNVPAPKPAAVPAGDVESGKRLYRKMGCPDCHGYEGQGAARTGPRIGPNPVPFLDFVLAHRKPSGQMPPYSSRIISDSELMDIYAFLSSLPKPLDPKTIPLLK
jgi:mono/diheme cytochrome c family protein